MPPVTIKEIALKAGLARSTVSEILSGKNNYCSEENRQKVKKIAAEMGYRPNIGFKIMTNRDSGTYSIIFSQERTYYTESNQTLASQLLREIESRQGSTYTAIFDNNADNNMERIRELVSRGSRKFIFLGYPVGIEKIYEFLRQEKCCYTSFNGYSDHGSRLCVMVDYTAVFREYFQYFRKHAMPFKVLSSPSFFAKVATPLCREFDLDPNNLLIPTRSLEHVAADCSDIYFNMALEKSGEFIRSNRDIHGWICASDIEALAVVNKLKEYHLPVEAEFGPLVCGFGNTSAARYSVQPIVTADLQLRKVSSSLLAGLKAADDQIIYYKPDIIFGKNSQ